MLRALLEKGVRFLRNPLRYFDAWTYRPRWRVAIWWYRSFCLPRIVKRVQVKKERIVLFLAMDVTMWRYDGVYRRLRSLPNYHPIIVTSPRICLDSRDMQIAKQTRMLEFFHEKGYEVLAGFDPQRDTWLDLYSLSPDIVFYTQPYNGNMCPRHFFWNMRHTLVCYAPYSFNMCVADWEDNSNLQNFCWRYFHLTRWHVEQCRALTTVKARNEVPVGYCLGEDYQAALADRVQSDQAWRKDRRLRVIWAPHHSIFASDAFHSSSFLEIHEEMVALREALKDKIVFAFKPHPHLRTKLEKIWGKARTDAYYADWANSPNSFLADGTYLSLFAGSDAMIHCCASFTVEYLYTGKPVLYYFCANRRYATLGEFGQAALDAHYAARTPSDVKAFLDVVVVKGDDPKREERHRFQERYLTQLGGKTFSERVVEEIEKGLGER